MYKILILAILATTCMISCRTAIQPLVKTADYSSIGFAEDTEEPAVKPYANAFPLLTNEQSKQLQDRFGRHQTEAMDIRIVSGDVYSCKSDWICTESSGAITCHCTTSQP